MKGQDAAKKSLFSKLGLPLGEDATKALFLVAVVVILVSGTKLLWQRFGSTIRTASQEALAESSIEVPPYPIWVRTDIRAEAVREGNLLGLPICQEDLTLRVAQAFRLHSWVVNVRRVRKQFGNRVLVDLEYRVPVAMVEVPDANQTIGLFPVDANGVFLPPNDFMPNSNPVVKIADFPRIRAQGTFPQGMPGTSWGDIRVQRGARLAASLMPVWNRMELALIIAHRGPTSEHGAEKPEFELRTRKNTVIFWGRAPDDEETSEPRAEKKIAWLADLFQQKGSLDIAAADQKTIDVRHIDGLDIATLGRRIE
jgi:hypothetical protein